MRQRRQLRQPNYQSLPKELHTEVIAPCFTNNSQELSNLALTSKSLYHFFQPKRLIDTLLSYVANGNQNAAEIMLKKNPHLMAERGSVIDPSGRQFKNISAFELVLWTLDVRYMGGMMLQCIPEGKIGSKIREQLGEQYDNVQENGVTYDFENKKVTESHFDFTPLINALETYDIQFNIWSFNERKKHWCTRVGKEQTKLPMHVRHHYCDPDEAFYPTPTFDKKELKRSLVFYNYIKKKVMVWDTGLSDLGVTFGIFRGARLHYLENRPPRNLIIRCARVVEEPHADVVHDLPAIRSLCKTRMLDLASLKRQLEQPIPKTEERPKSCCLIL